MSQGAVTAQVVKGCTCEPQGSRLSQTLQGMQLALNMNIAGPPLPHTMHARLLQGVGDLAIWALQGV